MDDTAQSTLPLSRAIVDRDTYTREHEGALDAAWRGERARALVVYDGQTLASDDGSRLTLFTPADCREDAERYYLGHADGAAYFAVRTPLPEPPRGTRTAGLRELGVSLPALHAGLAVHAIALERWHASHGHCPKCGARTTVAAGGSQRNCPHDGSTHFPRVDPAVIMLVHDGEDRCVLGHQPHWPERRFSVLAGFVEPGESLERAVAREVAEEVGLEVGDARYVASQPWPFPSSLMLGFTAQVTGGALHADGQEIAEARWFSRAELATAAADGSVLLPSAVSIARRLVEDWYGGPLASSW